MRLSNQQALLLLQIAQDSTKINSSVFAMSYEKRKEFVNRILNQQDTDVKEINETIHINEHDLAFIRNNLNSR